ncbi:MAG: hypothetical protein PHD70_14200 [Anaerostipes sp.]|jgi:uncharacterized membrane protein affecting hemolysin expression|nr:hypothetical protein [Anaerostipes sp.]MDD3747610.1 hypothetical protein [Anaerostipes sp.]
MSVGVVTFYIIAMIQIIIVVGVILAFYFKLKSIDKTLKEILEMKQKEQ